MAGMNLTADYQDATAGLSLTEGATYLVEFHGPPATTIRGAVAATKPSSDEDSLAYFNRDRNPQVAPPREFKPASGTKWWLRATDGASRVVAELIAPAPSD